MYRAPRGYTVKEGRRRVGQYRARKAGTEYDEECEYANGLLPVDTIQALTGTTGLLSARDKAALREAMDSLRARLDEPRAAGSSHGLLRIHDDCWEKSRSVA